LDSILIFAASRNCTPKGEGVVGATGWRPLDLINNDIEILISTSVPSTHPGCKFFVANGSGAVIS